MSENAAIPRLLQRQPQLKSTARGARRPCTARGIFQPIREWQIELLSKGERGTCSSDSLNDSSFRECRIRAAGRDSRDSLNDESFRECRMRAAGGDFEGSLNDWSFRESRVWKRGQYRAAMSWLLQSWVLTRQPALCLHR